MMATVDGPTEVHYVTVARQVLKEHKPSSDNWPTMFRPRRLLESRERFDQIVRERVAAGEQEQLNALVQQGEANDDAVKRFAEYLELTANV
jgi:acyl-CoA dehydrogenase